jgi:polysaccharide pyruvyl transferase WcaK-like protein
LHEGEIIMDKFTSLGYSLITGGCGFGNLGDEAILAQNLREERGEIAFKVLSPRPEQTRDMHDLDEWLVVERPYVPNFLSYCIKAMFSGVSSLLYNEVKWCKEIINVSGGNLTSYDKDELYNKLLIYGLARKFKKPVIFGAQTIGPLNKLDTFLLKRQLTRMILPHGIPVRDRMSMRILRGMSSCIPSEYAKDDAFHFEPKEGTCVPIKGFFDKGSEINTKIKVGVNLKGSLDMYGGNMSGVSTIVYTLCKFLLDRYYDLEIYLIPTSTGVNELRQLWELEGRLNNPRVSQVIPMNTPDEVKCVVSKMDVCIGVRYHFCVFALASDIPCIAIYSGKYQEAKLSGLLLNEDVYTKNLKLVDAKDGEHSLAVKDTISYLDVKKLFV